jgi:hypothetical protein
MEIVGSLELSNCNVLCSPVNKIEKHKKEAGRPVWPI